MADPLSMTASIITVLDLCTKIVVFLREVKGGSTQRNLLIREIYSTKGILESLIDTVQSADTTPEAWSKTIQSLKEKGSPLDLLQEVLTCFHDELCRVLAKGIGGYARSLLWPFKKEEVEERLRVMDRQNLLLTLALENDHIALSREIRSNTQVTRTAVTFLQADVEQRKDSEILNWLTPINYNNQQNEFLSRRQAGTGQWLLDSPQFQTWLEATGNKRTLFCPGIPGAGKTILTSVVIDDLTTRFENNETVGVAYIYFNFRRKLEQQTADILASLLKQLSQHRPTLPESVVALYNQKKKKQARPSVDELSAVFLSVITEYTKAFVVIDALDECQEFGGCRSRILTELFNLTRSGANLFVTSRFNREVEGKFDPMQVQSLEIRASKQDVEMYLEGNMPQLAAFAEWDEDIRESIKVTISDTVDGMCVI
jgi:hypothetical protein